MDYDYWFFVEDYFNELLSLERKRTERSKKPFLLLLLDVETIHGIEEKKEVIKKIASVLFSCTREIDIKGWYEDGAVIGVIFSEANGAGKNDKDVVLHKIVNGLYDALDLEQIKRIKVSLHVFPEEPDMQKPGIHKNDFHLYPDLFKRNSSNRNSRYMKRVMDIIGSVLGIVIFSPFLLIIPIFIKLTSKGAVLFKQERVGLFGSKFIFLKFRTMYANNDHNIHKKYVKELINGKICQDTGKSNEAYNGVYKIKDDSRITSLGRFLRKASLDELPQFFNVLKGDMSLVGPRPPIPYEVEDYDIWHKRRFLEIKPGITGLWQVSGRSTTTFDDMVRLDLKYSREASLWLDTKILLKTPWAILSCKGAY